MVRRMLNTYETVTHRELVAAMERWGLTVHPKVRVADVLSLDELGLSPDLYRYGLQAHFDFVLYNDALMPEYAVEFDGPGHSTAVQAARDRKKDRLCELDNFPILRINPKYLTNDFGRMTLLAWIIHVRELERGFYQAQLDGIVPDDEPFSPFMFLQMVPGEDRFPYWLSARPRIRLQELHKQGKIHEPISSGIVGYDEGGNLRGLEFIRLTDTTGTYVTSAMREQRFPLNLHDLFEEILVIQLVEKVLAFSRSEVGAIPLVEIYAAIERLEETLTLCGGHSYGCQRGCGRPSAG
jgi:hypothetical protein